MKIFQAKVYPRKLSNTYLGYLKQVVVNWEWFCPIPLAGDIWQCLKIFVIATIGGQGAASI